MPELNPLDGVGGIVGGIVSDFLNAVAQLLWNAVVGDLLTATFTFLDTLGSPDISPSGALLSGVTPITVGLGLFVAVFMAFVQIGRGVITGGRGLARLVIGLGQYALISAGGLLFFAVCVSASGGLAHGILESGLHVQDWRGVSTQTGFAQNTVNAISPLIVILLSVVLYLPAAFFLLFEVLFRYVALLVLAATLPILAAGLLADATRRWFHTGLRWAIALLLMEPAIALVLVIAFRSAAGITGAFGANDGAVASLVGLVVTGFVLIVALACPLALFKLLAFVDPHTVSGVRVRNALGGLSSGATSHSGGGAHGGAGSSGGSRTGGAGGGDPMEAASATHAGRAGSVSSRMTSALGEGFSKVSTAGDPLIGAAGSAAAGASRDFDGYGVGHQGYVTSAQSPSRSASSSTSAQSASSTSPPTPPGGGPSGEGAGGGDDLAGAITGAPLPPSLGDSGAAQLTSEATVQGEVLADSFADGAEGMDLSSTPAWPTSVPRPAGPTDGPGQAGSARAGAGSSPPSPSAPASTASSPLGPSSASGATGGGSGGAPSAMAGSGSAAMAGGGPGAMAGGGGAAGGAAGAVGTTEALEMAVVLL